MENRSRNTFNPGDRLGGYEILSVLGKGGMGEVWRARDTTLGREVAIKTLPVIFAQDRERVARFRREATLLASLNHPNIAVIHGLEESETTCYLVMELIDGKSLDELLQAGSLPVESAIKLAVQIAGALEAAHAGSVIHRDLKPANIKVRKDGTVKVLDFGLAKATSGDRADSSQVSTITEGLTMDGTIQGTPAYMSPEQIRGRPVDVQTDIWAFGCVLFEMLTGRRAFQGDDVSTILGRVLERSPDYTLLPEKIHPWLSVVVKKCLQKDDRQRFRDIGDIRLQLEQIALDPQGPSQQAPASGVHMRRRTFLVGGVAAVAGLGAIAGWSLRSTRVAEPVRTLVTLLPGVSVTRRQFASSVALSADGSTLVIAGTAEDGQRLYRRSLASLEVTPVAGTEGGSSPFFSPNGEWIGFFADGRLKKVPAGGGAPSDICVVPGTLAASPAWGPEDLIIFAPGAVSPLHQIHANGGSIKRLTTLEAGELSHQGSDFLPDGRTLLFGSGGKIYTFDLTSGKRSDVLGVDGYYPRYIGETGHIVLSRGPALLAAPFDASRRQATGAAVPLIEDVYSDTNSPHYAISSSGALAYVPAPAAYELVLVNADRNERKVPLESTFYQNPQFSPDGRRLAVAASRRRGNSGTDIWIYEMDTERTWQLTSNGARAPVWTPDGAAVTFSHLGERQGIYRQSATGLDDPELLIAVDQFHWLIGWTPDGRTLAYGTMEPAANEGRSESSLMEFSKGRTRRVLGPGGFWGGRLSPDGRFLVFYSFESGRFEVYVTTFPQGRRQWTIAEGIDPSWGPDGGKIFYRSGNRLMAARIEIAGPDGPVSALEHNKVYQPFLPPLYDDYHMRPKSDMLAMVRPFGDSQGREIVVVQNWFTELRRKVPAG